jgi:hypothetical protein
LADRIFNLDLFDRDGNKYGARSNKNVKVGKLGDNSYVPAGLSKAQYEKVRAEEKKKKDENYQRNVKKAGKFIDYTEWYMARGTDLSQGWKKSVTLGHRMAKTKFDWSGTADAKTLDSATSTGIFGKKAAAKKTVVAKKAAPKKAAVAAKKTVAAKKPKYFY